MTELDQNASTQDGPTDVAPRTKTFTNPLADATYAVGTFKVCSRRYPVEWTADEEYGGAGPWCGSCGYTVRLHQPT